jgi:hypothetical protein
MRLKAAAIIALSILCAPSAFAHRIDEYLQATVFTLEANRAQASMRLIPGVLVAPSVIAEIDANHDGVFSADEERAYARRVLGDLSIASDGKSVTPVLLTWSFPQPAQLHDGVGEIHIDYSIDFLPRGPARTLIFANHHLSQRSVYLMNVLVPQDPGIRIQAQKRNQLQSVYEIDYQEATAAVTTPQSPWQRSRIWLSGLQSASLFRLGMSHIAEGTDHLLFLLVLLLPAPLLVSGSRWGPPASLSQSLFRTLGIVTAFTIGHSITLGLAAFGLVHAPERPVEVLIAVSILVSAVHALRPILPGREAWTCAFWVTAFFGLIHGLAFAATLNRLGLRHWEGFAGILAFNVGIETMQMIVVAVTLPSLILLSRTRTYSSVRIGGAAFAGIASIGWIIERLTNQETPVDAIVNIFARHAPWIAVTLFLASLVCRFLPGYFGFVPLPGAKTLTSHRM